MILGFTVVAAVCLVAFVVWEWNQRHPIIDVRMFGDRTLATAGVLMLVVGFLLFAPLVLLPAFEQSLMGYTAQQAGETMSPGAITLIFLTPLVGALVARVEARRLVAVGAVLLAASQLYMAGHLHLGVDFRTALTMRIYQVAGLAFLFVPINTLVYAGVPREKNNAIAAIMNLGRNLGGSIGIAFVTTMIARRSQVHQAALARHTNRYDPEFTAHLDGLARSLERGGASAVDAAHRALAVVYREMQAQATQLAYLDTLLVLAFVAVGMLPLLLLVRASRRA
jgi:DHA2 family multidrug resistance protein